MKAILLVVLSTLMLSPALAFEQTDLDKINAYEQLLDVPSFDAEGFEGGDILNKNFFGKRQFVCVAKNRRGRQFHTQGRNRQNVRRRAMRQCRRNSRRPRTCQIVRCKRRGGKLNDLIDLIDLIDQLKG